MAKAIQGAAMIAGAIALDVATAGAATPFEVSLMTSLALGGLSMEAGAIANALSSNRGTGITIRQPAAYRQVVRGIRRVGGVMVYCSTTGSQHDQYNAVIVLAGHEVDAIENMYIDGRQVYWQGSGTGWAVRNGTGFGGIADGSDHVGPGGAIYNFGGTGHSGIYVEARYGDQTDPAGTNSPGNAIWTGSPTSVIGALTANDPNWAADGLGNFPWLGGCCYIYVKLEYNTSLFPSGPAAAELKFTIRGKNDIWDPRSQTWGYTSNWALHAADMLTDPVFGLGDIDGVDQTQLIAAANICDETVPLANGNSELRYAVHWAYDTSVSPGDAIANIMPAAGGRLSRIGGSWFIWPAYWQGPSGDFDQSALTGPVAWNPTRALRELYNRVNGTYIAANVPYNDAGNLYDSNGWYNGTILNNWPFGFQPTNFPQYAADVLHGYAEDLFLEMDSGVLGPYSGVATYNLEDVVTESGVIYLSLFGNNLGNDPATHSVAGGEASTWAIGTTYAAGQLVALGGNRYISLAGSNVGNNPLPISVTGSTTASSTTVSSLSSTAGLNVGLAISGAGIPPGATIATVGVGSLTLSAAATATATGVGLIISPAAPVIVTGSTTASSTAVASLSSTVGLYAGLPIAGAGIPGGTTIAAVGSGSLTLSAAATATATGVVMTASPATSYWAIVAWLVWSNQLPLELDLNCVLSVAQAQRVAKIALLRNRQMGSGTFPMHLACYTMQPLDLFDLTFPDYNWNGKQLEVVSTRFYLEQQDKSQAVRFEITAQEADQSVYEWSTAEELSVYDVPANPTNMPGTIAPPTGLALASNATTLYTSGSGTVYPQILASWTAPADVRVTGIQVQYQLVGAGTWTDAGIVSASSTSDLIGGSLIRGSQYDVQIRAIAANGATSVWVSAGPVTAFSPASSSGPLIFVDTLDGSFWSLTVAGGAPVYTKVSSGPGVSGVALIDTVDGSCWGISITGGAPVYSKISPAVFGVSSINFTDTVDSSSWNLTFAGGAPVYTL